MGSFLNRLYNQWVLEKPRVWLGIIALAMLGLGFTATQFKLDASSDSLMLENDEDLKYSRKVNKTYGPVFRKRETLPTLSDILKEIDAATADE